MDRIYFIHPFEPIVSYSLIQTRDASLDLIGYHPWISPLDLTPRSHPSCHPWLPPLDLTTGTHLELPPLDLTPGSHPWIPPLDPTPWIPHPCISPLDPTHGNLFLNPPLGVHGLRPLDPDPGHLTVDPALVLHDSPRPTPFQDNPDFYGLHPFIFPFSLTAVSPFTTQILAQRNATKARPTHDNPTIRIPFASGTYYQRPNGEEDHHDNTSSSKCVGEPTKPSLHVGNLRTIRVVETFQGGPLAQTV